MALIKCSECSAEISDKASCCPKCGAPVVAHKWRCSKCGHIISEEPCPYCSNAQTAVNTNTAGYESNVGTTPAFVAKNKRNLGMLVACLAIVAIVIIAVVFSLKSNKNKKTTVFDMGSIGNKIIVDGRVAYVAGENKILVPYGFCGNFIECSSVVDGKSLKGCENPRLPAYETDDLPEEVAEEIISFYGDIGGFWTSIEADHATIEIVGNEPESLHYAGIMDNYFIVGSDGVADAAWGYCLDGTNDATPMGLLVLYDVIVDKFEFTDFVSNSQTPISINQNFFSDLGLPYSEISKKYGEVTQSGFLDGGGFYIFENGHGLYFFKDKNGNSAFFDENDTSEYPKPKIPNDDAECFLVQANITDLFNNFKGCKPIVDVEQELGVSIECFEDDVDGGYMCRFDYENYSVHQIDIGASKKYILEDSTVRVKRKE